MTSFEYISTEKAPAAIGPYSQAIKVGDFLYASGQIPIDPSNGEIDGKDIKKYSEELRERQNDLTIRLLKEQIERFEKYIEEAKNREKEYEEKFSNMYNELKKGNIIKKILYRPVIRIINEEFSRIDEKEEYVIDSQDEKLQIDHEKIDKDYTEPLSEKEKEVEKLKNTITDKKVELLEVEKKIGTLIKKIEIIKLKTENIGE